MVNPTINIYLGSGYNSVSNTAVCSAYLEAKAPDGRMVNKSIVKTVAGRTKGQAEILSACLALRCIKPDQRNTAPVVINTQSRYLITMFGRKDGKWTAEAHTNLREVEDMRALISQYSDLVAVRGAGHSGMLTSTNLLQPYLAIYDD